MLLKPMIKNRQSGFTLIELSIWLIVVGLITLPLLTIYKNYINERILGINNGKFTTIQAQVNNFAVNNGRYPVPASLLDNRTNPTFGQSVTTAILPCTAWPTANGICRTAGPGPDPILIGAVPFADLGISPEFGHDYWGNKILYAVTETQTGVYTPGNARIDVWAISDEVTQAEGILTGQFDMILVSHGESGAGAYTKDGVLVSACPAPAAGREYMNCDFDDQFALEANPAFNPVITGLNNSLTSSAPGVRFFDDLTEVQDSVPVDLWLQNLTDANFALTFASKIAVGIQNPDPAVKVHVVGDVLADRILTNGVCDDTATDCFDPIHITGDEPEMDCANNTLANTQAVMRLQNEQVDCASSVDTGGGTIDGVAFEFPATFSQFNCNTGAGFGGPGAQLMVGINASGDPICVTP